MKLLSKDNNKEFTFDVYTTTAIKGIAILIMLWHHFFWFPAWLYDGISFFKINIGGGYSIETILASFGKVCISIYTLLSGYGLYASFIKKKHILDYKYVIKKCVEVLFNWWLVFLLFVLAADVFNGYIEFDFIKAIKYLFLVEVSGTFVGFLKFYLIALITFPIWMLLLRITKWDIIWVILMPIVSIGIRHVLANYGFEDTIIYTYFLYIPYLLTGSYICKNKWYEKIYQIYNKMGVFRIPVICLCLIAMILIRELSGKGLVFDSWVAAVLVFCFACMLQGDRSLKRNVHIKVLNFLGKHSTNIWYIHAILIYPSMLLQQILYAPYIPIVILIWGVIICLPGSMLVNLIMKYTIKKFYRFLDSRKEKRHVCAEIGDKNVRE